MKRALFLFWIFWVATAASQAQPIRAVTETTP